MQRMPDEVSGRARQLLEGAWQPPVAHDAATVVLVRDAPDGLEVLLTERPATMAFAPGMHVFPGGRVDPGTDDRVPVLGAVLGGDWAANPRTARTIWAAAVRETFEEVGLLLARDCGGRFPHPDDHWQRDRDLVATQPEALATVLTRRGLAVRADDLVPIAHWVTPEVEARRFDTRFLAARAPGGQAVRPDAREIADAGWVTPTTALDQHRRGQRPMLPPTVAVLAVLVGSSRVDDVLARARLAPPVPTLPRPARSGPGITWNLVHAYSGVILAPAREPAGSEVAGRA